MCGEVPKGHYAIDVVVHLQNNQTTVKVPLTRKLEWVTEVWLTEYQVDTAGAVGAYRLGLGNMLKQQQISNVPGDGFVFAVDATTVTHVVYQKPRKVTVDNRGWELALDVSVRNVTNGAIEIPTYSSATFFLTFILKDPSWSPELELFIDKSLPQNTTGQFSTRAPFF